MSKPQPFQGKQAAHQSAPVLPLAFGFAALVVLALWLHDPAVAQLVLLAAALPALVVLAYGVLRILAASEPRGWRWPGRYRQWRDMGSGLLAGPALAKLGQRLLERSQRRGEPLAVLVFDFDDRDQVKDLYSVRLRRQMLSLIGRELRRLAGRKGLALRQTPSRFVVLLPGCTRAVALERAAARLGVPCSFELDSAQDELVLVPRLTALGATAETDSLEALLSQVDAPRQRRPAASTGFSSAPVHLSEGRPAAKPKFDLPDLARLPNYSAFPTTVPLPLRAAARESHSACESKRAARPKSARMLECSSKAIRGCCPVSLKTNEQWTTTKSRFRAQRRQQGAERCCCPLANGSWCWAPLDAA